MERERAVAWLLALSMVASGAPAVGDHAPSCSAVTDQEAAGVQGVYLRSTGERVEVWEEANGVEGLQTETCHDADGIERSPDEHVDTVEAPSPPSTPGVPDVPNPWHTCTQLLQTLFPTLRCR